MEAGADIEDRCWDTSPLMAAAHSGHIWAVETLVRINMWGWFIFVDNQHLE